METISHTSSVFPTWTNGVLKALNYCRRYINKPGIYCIEYPKLRDDDIRKIINGFTNCFGTFVHYKGWEFIDPEKPKASESLSRYAKKGQPTIEGKMNPNIEDFIKKNSIPYGRSQLKVVVNGKNEILLQKDGKTQPLENDSYKILVYSIVAAHTLTQDGDDLICFMIDIGRLDRNNINFICGLFKSIHEEIIDQGKHLILLFSEDKTNNIFTVDYLWSESIFDNFATITDDDAWKLTPFRDSKKIINDLSDKVKKTKTISLFLGSGASVSSGAPTTSRLLKLSLKELLNLDENDIQKLKEEYMNYVESKEGERIDIEQVTFERVMSSFLSKRQNLDQTNAIKEFKEKTEKGTPSEGYKRITKIASKYRVLITTTNFDKFCDSSIDKHQLLFDEASYKKAHDSNYLEKHKDSIIAKLHGDIFENPRNLGITKDTVSELLPQKKIFFRSFLKGKQNPGEVFDVVFIGYGFNDDDVMEIVNEAIENEGYNFTPIFVDTIGNKGLSQIMRKIEESKSKSNISIHNITMSFDRFMEELSNEL